MKRLFNEYEAETPDCDIIYDGIQGAVMKTVMECRLKGFSIRDVGIVMHALVDGVIASNILYAAMDKRKAEQSK